LKKQANKKQAYAKNNGYFKNTSKNKKQKQHLNRKALCFF
jgi:hypothetical protein